MRIVYVGGNCGEGSAPWATENAYIDAFRKLGHEVLPVKQQDAYGYDFDGLRPNLVIYTRTHNNTALPPAWTAVWRQMEERGIRTASIHLDVFRGIPEREEWVERGDPLFTTGTVFTADGSEPDWWKDRGVNHVWLPPAFDNRHLDVYAEAFADSLPRPIDAAGKVIFVGSEGYHSCYSFRPQLVQHLRATYGDRFLLVGGDGPFGKLRMAPLAALYAEDAIFVGDHCFATERRPNYWSDRFPETLGRGGLLLYPNTPGLEDQGFVDWQDYVSYDGLDQLDRMIAALTEVGAEWRQETGARGREKVLAAHTYDHRAVQVLRTLGLA